AEILQRLGMAVVSRAKDRLTVRVPNFRRDVEREIDLIVEVARIYGYDNIPSRTLVPACPAPPNRRECVLAETGQVFAAAGYFEAVSHTLSTDGAARLFLPGGNVEPLKVLDSSSAARASLRMSVVPGLLEAKRVNQDAGRVAVKFFEIANRFVPVAGQTLPDENARLAILADDDFFAVKGVLETLFDALGLAHHAAAFESTDAYEALVAGESAAIVLDGESLGFIGRVEASLAEQFGLDAAPVVAEVDFDRLVAAANLAVQFHALPQFPAVERDLAIVVEESVTWARVDAAVRSEGVAELEAVEFLDVYRGKQVPEGKKSIAFRMRFRSAAGTLTHEGVDVFQEQVLARLKKDLSATLRA
ncbi:MAG: hypothetical protein QGD94_12700, partial [Planctomycetia bacterium]|nr:hypothetical protein [Planctomycetia bacterium]